MSVPARDWAWTQIASLDIGTRLLLLYLAEHAGADGRNPRPRGMRRIHADTGLCRDTIVSGYRELEAHRLVTLERPARGLRLAAYQLALHRSTPPTGRLVDRSTCRPLRTQKRSIVRQKAVDKSTMYQDLDPKILKRDTYLVGDQVLPRAREQPAPVSPSLPETERHSAHDPLTIRPVPDFSEAARQARREQLQAEIATAPRRRRWGVP